jgi:hypothetical protein
MAQVALRLWGEEQVFARIRGKKRSLFDKEAEVSSLSEKASGEGSNFSLQNDNCVLNLVWVFYSGIFSFLQKCFLSFFFPLSFHLQSWG